MSKFDIGKKGREGKQREYKENNIVHVTYDTPQTSRRGRATSRPSHPGAFSSQNGLYAQSSKDLERPITPWPSRSHYQIETQTTVANHHGNTYAPYSTPLPLQHKGAMPNITTAFINYESSLSRPIPGVVDDIHREIREGRLEQTIPPGEEHRLPPPGRRCVVQSFPPRSEAKYLPNNKTRPALPQPGFSSQVRGRASSMSGLGSHQPVSYTQPDSQGNSTKKKRNNSFRDRFAGGIDTIKAVGAHIKDVFTPRARNRISLSRTDSNLSDKFFACQGDPADLADKNERETNAKAIAAFQADKYHHKKILKRTLKVETRDGSNTGQPLSPRLCADCKISLVKGMRTLCYPCERRHKMPKPIPAITRESTNLGNLPSGYHESEERDPSASFVSPIHPTGYRIDRREARGPARPLRAPYPPPKDDYLTQWEAEIKPAPPLKDLKYSQYASKPSASATVLNEARVNTSAAERFGEEDIIFEPYRRRMTPEQRESFALEQIDGDGWDSYFRGGKGER